MKGQTFEPVLQEDDCAPDAMETFSREFEKLVGCSIQEFKKTADRYLLGGGVRIVRYLHPWKLSICADDPYYLLEKVE